MDDHEEELNSIHIGISGNIMRAALTKSANQMFSWTISQYVNVLSTVDDSHIFRPKHVNCINRNNGAFIWTLLGRVDIAIPEQ